MRLCMRDLAEIEMALFRNDSPGALTMEQAIARHTARLEQERRRIAAEQKAKAEAKARAKKARMAEKLAAESRGEDSEVAHVTPGEMVIPRAFQTPEVLAALAKVAAAHGVALDRFLVGDAHNSVNPTTGAPEFGFFGDIWDNVGNSISNLFGGPAQASQPSPAGSQPSVNTNQMSGYGQELVKQREGNRTHIDQAGHLTTGYGHKGPSNLPPEEQFKDDVVKYDRIVNQNINVPLTQSEHDALSSLVFNIGEGNFANSSLPGLVNAGKFEEAANMFPQFNNFRNRNTQQMEVSRGLVNRRAAERDQFLADTLFVRGRRIP